MQYPWSTEEGTGSTGTRVKRQLWATMWVPKIKTGSWVSRGTVNVLNRVISLVPQTVLELWSTALYNSIILRKMLWLIWSHRTGLDILVDHYTEAIMCETGIQKSFISQFHYLILVFELSRTSCDSQIQLASKFS